MAAAAALEKSQKDERLQDERRWKTSITTLIRHMMEVSEQRSGRVSQTRRLSESLDTVLAIDLQSSLLDELVKRPEVKKALDDLDINPDDQGKLSELLDPDNGGTISVVDFIDGLKRLRGEPRRSDIVNVNMMVRALQLALSETQAVILDMQTDIGKINDFVTLRRNVQRQSELGGKRQPSVG
eukprot:CAMPEP_0115362688 /NCGR_PEP_ID=MMETSP0270-20121206/102833_1 /TAXON_ID=71861 /ORGANISM="Scrippsiella trochoidea, Strain CCMP3099" /LENGTH=182 /DNA_ID=CAMNT_0002785265 /DNA_START=163 /DNA_END=708 /DNA_ORIENTATION=-